MPSLLPLILKEHGATNRDIAIIVSTIYMTGQGGRISPPIQESHGHWWSGIRNYAKECFGHSYYWWVFLTYSCLMTYSCLIWGGCAGVFGVFFLRDEIGLSLAQIGTMGAVGAMALLAVLIPFGWLLDRWGGFLQLFPVLSRPWPHPNGLSTSIPAIVMASLVPPEHCSLPWAPCCWGRCAEPSWMRSKCTDGFTCGTPSLL